MHDLVGSRLETIAQACRKKHVLRLELFGSAASTRFDPDVSDIDFIVTFENLEPVSYVEAYFGIAEDLEELFKRPVDVIVESTLKNPYFIQEIQKIRTLVYAA